MQDGLALYAEMQERAAKLQEAMKAEKQAGKDQSADD